MKRKCLIITWSVCTLLSLLLGINNPIHASELNPDEELINLALNKPIIASSFWDDKRSPEKAVDGIVSSDSRWVSKYVNGEEKPEWIRIDLGKGYTIDEVRVNFEAAYASEFTIQGSLDDITYFDILQVTDGKKDENIYKGLSQKKAQYIKLDLTKQGREDKKYGFSIYEIEVYDYTQIRKTNMNAQKWAEYIKNIPPTISDDGKKIILPETQSDEYEISLYGSDNKQVITMDGSVHQPLQDMKVNLLYKVQNIKKKEDFATTNTDVSITIPGIYQTMEGDNDRPKVIPGIREWKGNQGDFQLTKTSKIIVNDTNLRETAKVIQRYFKDMLQKDIAISSGSPVSGDILLECNEGRKDLGEEGNYIEITDYIKVTAFKEKGVLYGGITITQILYQNALKNIVPKGLIRDYPKYEVRSGMIDVGRMYIPLEYLTEMTVYMSWFKLNEMQVHINDYWGSSGYSAFRLESDTYPEIVSKDGHYTKEEYRQYQKDMHAYGVDVITEIDTPYHAESFRVIPGVKMLKKGALDIRDEFSYTVIENLIDEYIDGEDPIIVSDNFHIGTDEYDQNYPEEMRKWTDHFIRYVNNKGKKSRLWGSLGGGTAPNGFEGDTSISNDATMNIWAPYWSDVQEMYKLGYDIINTCGGWLYIVPAGNAGYPDRLDIRNLYDTFEVNDYAPPHRQPGKGSAVMPFAHPQTKGAEFAIWNDNTSFNIGFSEFDIFDRVRDAVLITSEKTWYGEKTEGQTADTFMERVEALSNKVPLVNPSRYVESDGDMIVHYTGSSVKGNQAMDQSPNENNATLHNVTIKEGNIEFNDENSYMQLPMESIGYPYTISMEINIIDYDQNSKLFSGKDGVLYASIDDTGKLGFERLHGRFVFDYTLPKGEDINLILVGNKSNLALYINGVFVSNGILIEKPIQDREQKSSTFILPGEEILRRTKATLKDFRIYNYALTKEEIADTFDILGYRENLALNKPVTASSNATNLLPSAIVDGDGSSRWGSNYTNGVEKPEWLIIDLEDVYAIDEIRISWETAYASGYKILGSIDGEKYFVIKTISNGKGALDIHSELGKKETRYIKFDLHTQGRDDKKYGFSIWEIEIYESTNKQLERITNKALTQLQTYTRGYEKGNFPVDIYDSWQMIFNGYLEIASGKTLSEYQKVGMITDIMKKMNAMRDTVLEEDLVSKEDLKSKYNEIIEIEESAYTPKSYKIIKDLLPSVKAVLENPAATQDSVNKEYENLNNAFNNLIKKADTSRLNEEIKKAEKINQKEYTKESYENLLLIIKEAKVIFEDVNISQKEVEDVIDELQDAIKKLKYPNRVFTSEDGKVIVEGNLPSNIEVVIVKIENMEEIVKTIKNKDFIKQYEVKELYSILLYHNDNLYQPIEKVKITLGSSINYSEKTNTIVHITENGGIEVLEATFKEGKISFYTNSFSYYGIVGTKEDSPVVITPNSPNFSHSSKAVTGDETDIFWLWKLCILNGVIIIFVVIKKKIYV